MQRLAVPVAILFAGVALAFGFARAAPLGVDYAGHGLDVTSAGDAVQSLSEVRISRFFATQPPIGPVSVLVRAPFAALAHIGHDVVDLRAADSPKPAFMLPRSEYASQLRLYRFGIFPCMVALAGLAAFAAASLGAARRTRRIQLLVGLLLLGSPLWKAALDAGHPAELLTAALMVGGVLAAYEERWTAAGILLGLAIASKQWALLALPVVAVTVPVAVLKKTVGTAIGTCALVMVPMIAGDPHRFFEVMTSPSISAQGVVDPHSIWFPLAGHATAHVFDGVTYVALPDRHLPGALASATHPLILVLAVVLSLAFTRSHRRRDTSAMFGLLALVFLLRCLLDPVTNTYYHVPFLAALALYEGHSRRQLPVLTLLVTAASLVHFGQDATSATWANIFYLTWTVPLAIGLALSLFWPSGASRISAMLAARPLGPNLAYQRA